MICAKCGAEFGEDTQYCPECGARITSAQRDQLAAGAHGDAGVSADETAVMKASLEGVTAPLRGGGDSPEWRDKASSGAPKAQPSGVKRDLGPAFVVLAAVAGLALLGFLFWAIPLGGLLRAFEPQEPVVIAGSAETEEEPEEDAGPVALMLTIDAFDSSEYPHMVIDFTLSSESDRDLSSSEEGRSVFDRLTDASFLVEDRVQDDAQVPVQIDSLTLRESGSSWSLECTAQEPAVAGTHILELSIDPASGFSASASVQFIITEANTADDGDGEYLLPGSSTRAIDASELEDLSDWELCLARNEIYARHGRMFNNTEIQAYFDSQSWYEPLYAPADFDEQANLSQIELENIDTIYAYEQERGSSYVS